MKQRARSVQDEEATIVILETIDFSKKLKGETPLISPCNQNMSLEPFNGRNFPKCMPTLKFFMVIPVYNGFIFCVFGFFVTFQNFWRFQFYRYLVSLGEEAVKVRPNIHLKCELSRSTRVLLLRFIGNFSLFLPKVK